MVKNCKKHNWHFVQIYYTSPLRSPFIEKRMATFICDCGCMKEVEVKLINGN